MADPQQTPAPLLSIRQVAQRTGLPPSTIRYYDQQFEDYLDIRRGAGRRRLFSELAVERLLQVQRMLKEEGLSLRQARQALAGQPGAAGAQAGGGRDNLRAQVEELRQEVGALDKKLRDLKDIQQRTLALIDSLTRG